LIDSRQLAKEVFRGISVHHGHFAGASRRASRARPCSEVGLPSGRARRLL